MTEIERICINCKWWDSGQLIENAYLPPGPLRLGLCRYNAPKIIGGDGEGAWPVTIGEEWCGVFTLKPEDCK